LSALEAKSGLAVEELSFGYRGRAVGGPVSFIVGPGEIMCLLGPNGGGKTTLFKTVLGLLTPFGGRVLMDGVDTAGWNPRRRAQAIGYVPQSGAGQFPFTVHEMVLMGRTAHRGTFAAPSAADHDAADAALATLGIAGLGPRDWLRLSGGERQLALVARALAQEPRLLILDEPTANLDFGNQLRVLEQVRRLAAGGLAVLFSTHHPEQAFACASQVALLQGGTLARIGTPDATITSETMQLLYGTEVDIVSVGAAMKACVPHAWREAR
jgi:iron complex transport system ATP-binding protein